MELLYILVIDLFCMVLATIGIYKIPMVALFGLIISLTVVMEQIISSGISDTGIFTLSIVTIVMCATCLIWGLKRQ